MIQSLQSYHCCSAKLCLCHATYVFGHDWFDPMSIHTRSRLANTGSGSTSLNQSVGSANRLETQLCSVAVKPSNYNCMCNANRSCTSTTNKYSVGMDMPHTKLHVVS